MDFTLVLVGAFVFGLAQMPPIFSGKWWLWVLAYMIALTFGTIARFVRP